MCFKFLQMSGLLCGRLTTCAQLTTAVILSCVEDTTAFQKWNIWYSPEVNVSVTSMLSLFFQMHYTECDAAGSQCMVLLSLLRATSGCTGGAAQYLKDSKSNTSVKASLKTTYQSHVQDQTEEVFHTTVCSELHIYRKNNVVQECWCCHTAFQQKHGQWIVISWLDWLSASCQLICSHI